MSFGTYVYNSAKHIKFNHLNVIITLCCTYQTYWSEDDRVLHYFYLKPSILHILSMYVIEVSLQIAQ